MYQFQYKISENDYIAFNMFHVFHSPGSKRRMLYSRFIIPIAFVVFSLVIGTIAEASFLSNYFYITFGLAAIFWFVCFKRIMIRQIKKNIKRIKKEGKLPYEADSTIFFGEDFFTEITESGESKMKYSAIERVEIDVECIYIYTNAVQAVLLPFSIFDDERNRADFLQFIQEKRGGKC